MVINLEMDFKLPSQPTAIQAFLSERYQAAVRPVFGEIGLKAI